MPGERTRGSLLRNWHASLKIPALMVLIFSMAFMRALMPVLVLLPLSLLTFSISGLHIADLMRYLKTPLLLVLAVGLFIALFSGEIVLLRIGPLSLMREGVIAGASILLRVTGIMIIGFLMVRTTSLSEISTSLRRMRLPGLLVDMGILTGRYIMVIGEDHERMTVARRLRGYSHAILSRRFFKVMAPVTATLLVRGFKRSERVFGAMKTRGYGATTPDESIVRPLEPSDVILFSLTVLISAGLIMLELTA
jgi:cobalt/nickel transport system permease protein